MKLKTAVFRSGDADYLAFPLVICAAIAMLWFSLPGRAQSQNLTPTVMNGQMIALESNVAACQRGGTIMPFVQKRLQVDGVRYSFLENPSNRFPGGIAVAALYRLRDDNNGATQGQFCVDGACLAQGNRCSAIAFIQPNGVRMYARQ